MSELAAYAAVIGAIFALNLVPAFGPPTWAVLVLFSLHGNYHTALLVVCGAIAAASGRLVLASVTRRLGSRLPARWRSNLDGARDLLGQRSGRMIALLALFAISPLPSAQLFEAAGLVSIRLVPLTLAFFSGRLVSYSLYVGGAAALSVTDTGRVLLSSLTSPWSVVLQVLMLVGLVLLAKVDWAAVARRSSSRTH